MLSDKKIVLSRAELYERVWTTPMHKLAKEFGLSDVGLAKLCRRHNIPLPGRGYWARIQFGQNPQKTTLPAANDTKLETVEIFHHEPRPTEQFKVKDERPVPAVEVREDRQITHPFAIILEKSISRSKFDERGLLKTTQGRVVPFKVSMNTLPRTLRILDAFFSALDQSKFKLDWPKPYNTVLTIRTDGEQIRIFIAETIQRSEHKPTKEEIEEQKRHSWHYPPRWDYNSTGQLKFTLESVEFPIQSSWSDGKRRRLEDCLGEIIVECERTAPAVKKAREMRAEQERQWAEQRRKEQEAAIRRAEYERKAKAIKKLSQQWQESKCTRDFANDLKLTAESCDVADSVKEELRSMIEWTIKHADYLDPLTDLNWTVREFKAGWF